MIVNFFLIFAVNINDIKMLKSISTYIILIWLSATYTEALDDIDLELESGAMGKLLRAMENQTNADTLNLPANASSIRENITDTFSCDNRTYGYYADVDNECQLFHVCLPSQTASGRSVMYKWSFICPAETVFNQEVLVCTRPREAINCEDSPMYYDLNMEIGKESNDTKSETEDNSNVANVNKETNDDKELANKERVKVQRRKPVNKKKQNLIVESLIKEVVREELKNEDLTDKNLEVPDLKPEIENKRTVQEVKFGIPLTVIEDDFEDSRIYAERSLKKNKKLKRGIFRFIADV